MNNLKSEFIKAIMQSLKIDNNPFISATIEEYISHLHQTKYKSFMSKLFGTQHQYLNGLDRVAKVAEQFKPQTSIDEITLRAKQLIRWCENANSIVFDNSTKSGRTFEDELKGTKFTNLNDSDLAILNAVRPYCDHKQVTSKIRAYQTSEEAINAFKTAIKFTSNRTVQIRRG